LNWENADKKAVHKAIREKPLVEARESSGEALQKANFSLKS
jgi:hypothetical protein